MDDLRNVTRMSFCVLGSGSGGNCSVLLQQSASGERRITLIDLGLSPRQTKRRLELVGLTLEDVDDAIITHFDTDHFYSSWTKKGRELGLTVRYHRRHIGWAKRAGAAYLRSEPFDDVFDLGGCEVRPVCFTHDHQGTTGYRIESNPGSLGFATDLGRVPATLASDFAGVNVLAIESNYCPLMQRMSGRPIFLQRRIMGGSGHLSNEEAFTFIRELNGLADLQRVVLLHLSRQCNTPDRALSHFTCEPKLAAKVVLTSQTEPSEWVEVKAPPPTAARRQVPVTRPAVETQPSLFPHRRSHIA